MEQQNETAWERLLHVQEELKAPKSKNNKFANYKYRSAEDILEAAKPILAKYKILVVLSDKTKSLEGKHVRNSNQGEGSTETDGRRVYVVAKATAYDAKTGMKILSVKAEAREDDAKKGCDGPQVTGTSSSYARKYALNGLFLIDDTKDPDTEEYEIQTGKDQERKQQQQPAKQAPKQEKAPTRNHAPMETNKTNIELFKEYISMNPDKRDAANEWCSANYGDENGRYSFTEEIAKAALEHFKAEKEK